MLEQDLFTSVLVKLRQQWTASYVNLMSDQVVSFISTCEETGDKVDDFISIFNQIYDQ